MSADFHSPFLAIGLSSTRPGFDRFCVDSLGGGAVEANPALAVPADPARVCLKGSCGRWSYHLLGCEDTEPAWWTVDCSERTITLRSEYRPLPSGFRPFAEEGFRLTFRQAANHATLLGVMAPGEELMRLPCVLHLPDLGSCRITASVPDCKLIYRAQRTVEEPQVRFVHVRFPAATAAQGVVSYRIEVVCLHPELPGLEGDSRFDPFRRNYLNGFQVSPRYQMLATNAASDICPFALFMHAEMAAPGVRLADGLGCLDLVRMTADRYLDGVVGYGQPGHPVWGTPWTSLDTPPSLVLGPGLYVQNSGNLSWGERRHARIMDLCHEMLASDRTGDGLLCYPSSGNLGDRPTHRTRPSNWWDTINFGHQDAYANAIAYRALTTWAGVARDLGHGEDATWLDQAARRLRAAYVPTFLNPATGVLAGWRSADGQLHDYGFLFLNSLAVNYGLLDPPQARAVMERMIQRLGQVGYRHFGLGLPGNLQPIPRGDYIDHGYPEDPHQWGTPQLEDGSDGFPWYENGGASMRFSLFTLRALAETGHQAEAWGMLEPMLGSYRTGLFQGYDARGRSRDWNSWNGEACGYEGFAVGNYLPLLAVPYLQKWLVRDAI